MSVLHNEPSNRVVKFESTCMYKSLTSFLPLVVLNVGAYELY